MKARRIFALTLVILLLATTLVACKSNKIIIIENEKEKDDVTSITFYGYKADDLNLIAIENAMHAYMKDHSNISVNYEGVKGTAYWNALELRYKTGNLDDVIMVDQARLMSMGNDLADLKDVVDPDMFNDVVKSQIVLGDTIKYIPMNMSSFCLYVNHDLLKADGKRVPENLDELRALCHYYVNEKHVTPIICNNNNSLRTWIEACGFYNPQNPLDVDAINANPVLLADYLSEGLELVDEMIRDGWIDADATLHTSQTAGDMEEFIKGQAPFMITGGWVSIRLKDMLSKAGKTMDFGVYPYPVKSDGCVLLLNVTTCISVNANGAHVEEAKNFVGHFVNPDSVWEYCDTQCCFSPLKNETRIPSEPTVAPTAEYYTNGRAVIGADFRIDVPVDVYITECAKMMLQGTSLEDAVDHLRTLLAGQA